MENTNVKKYAWGYELIWAKTEMYTGKILFFEHSDVKTDMVFHKETTKSWFVNNGTIKITWIDTDTGTVYEKEFSEGSTFTIAPLTPVELVALTPGSSITEVNNQKSETDIFIVARNSDAA